MGNRFVIRRGNIWGTVCFIALSFCLAGSLRSQSATNQLSGERAVRDWSARPWADVLSAAQKGDPAPQYVAAWRLFHGEDVKQDVYEGIRWFRRAAEQGVPEAQFKMGIIAEQGIGGRKNSEQARNWYERAAQAGYIPAVHNLAAFREGEEQVRLLFQTAEAGYPVSSIALLSGRLPWFKIRLGEEQKQKALALCLQVAKTGDPEAEYLVGMNYFNAPRDRFDLVESIKWLQLAANQGHRIAAQILSAGLGHPTAEQMAEAQRRAKDFQPLAPAQDWLHAGRLLAYRNLAPPGLMPAGHQAEFDRLKEAAKRGDPKASFELALSLQHPMLGTDWNSQEAETALMLMSQMYSGFLSRQSSGTNSNFLLNRSQPPPFSGLNMRVSASVAHYRTAAEAGNTFAALSLGYMYTYGQGAPNSPPEAVRWWKLAAEAGIVEAQFELGKTYLTGGVDPANTADTVQKKSAQALHYLQLAAAQNHSEARLLLKKEFPESQVSGSTPTGSVAHAAPLPRPGSLPRLAIVPLSPELAAEADLLTVQFTKSGNVELLERADIQRVQNELSLAAQNSASPLRLGQTLKADGLLLLEYTQHSGRQLLSARLVAVAPGITLALAEYDRPLKDVNGWSDLVQKKFSALLPKLNISTSKALAISLLNFRSTIASANSSELERQMTALLENRLLQEPDIFVLERTRMGALKEEQQYEAWENRGFWTGSYLLDGTFQPSGSDSTVKLTVRLLQPSGRPLTAMEWQGDRNQLAPLVGRMTTDLLKALKRSPQADAWNPLAEAANYLDEARWSLKWNMPEEATAAVENCLALGLRNEETGVIQVALLERGLTRTVTVPYSTQARLEAAGTTNHQQLEKLQRAVAFYLDWAQHPPAGWSAGGEWLGTGTRLLETGLQMLNGYHEQPVAQIGRARDLASTREKLRRLRDYLLPYPSTMFELERTLVEKGGCLAEQPSDYLPYLLNLVRTGFDHDRRFWIGGKLLRRPPLLISWDKRQSDEQLLALWKSNLWQIARTNDFPGQLEALLILTSLEKADHERSEAAALLMDRTWTEREQIFHSPLGDDFMSQAAGQMDSFGFNVPDDFIESSRLKEAAKDFVARIRQASSERRTAAFHASLAKPAANSSTNTNPPPASAVTNAVSPPAAARKTIVITNILVVAALKEPLPVPRHPPQFWQPPVLGSQPVTGEHGLRVLGWKQREDDLWVRADFAPRRQLLEGTRVDSVTTFLYRIRLPSLQTETIPVPARLMPPNRYRSHNQTPANFEVLQDRLFLLSAGQMLSCPTGKPDWQVLSTGLPENANLWVVDGHLLVSSDDSLLEVNPASGEIQLLASTRRRPAANPLDNLGSFLWVRLAAGPSGTLLALLEHDVYQYDFKNHEWSQRGALPGFGFSADLQTRHPEGWQMEDASPESAAILRDGASEIEDLAQVNEFRLDFPKNPMAFGSSGPPGFPGFAQSMRRGPGFGEERYLLAFDQTNTCLLQGRIEFSTTPNLRTGRPFRWQNTYLLWRYESGRTAPARLKLEFPVDGLLDPAKETTSSNQSEFGQFRLWCVKAGLVLWHPQINGCWFVPWADIDGIGLPKLTPEETSANALLAKARRAAAQKNGGTQVDAGGLLLRDRIRRQIRTTSPSHENRLSLDEFRNSELLSWDSGLFHIGSDRKQIMENIDTNHDGWVDVDEIIAMMEIQLNPRRAGDSDKVPDRAAPPR